MNKQGKNGIIWCDYTWSPVTGCLKNCPYCYAKRIAMRFDGHFNPTFHKERLKEPSALKKPSTIFVCSMAELFGEWNSLDWAVEIMKVVKDNPQHRFMFLTKVPERMALVDFPDNAWAGITIENQQALEDRGEFFKANYGGHKFLSIEPLLGEIEFPQGFLSEIELVIIGADSSKGASRPCGEWVKQVLEQLQFSSCDVVIKQSLLKCFPSEESLWEIPGRGKLTGPEISDYSIRERSL